MCSIICLRATNTCPSPPRLGPGPIAVGEQNSLGRREESTRMFKKILPNVQCALQKKKSLLKCSLLSF